MKFLIDENLPPALAVLIRKSGFEAKHVNDFGNTHPISDNALRRFALHKNWVVITRDDDFVKSYVSNKVPEKLIYVFGFNRKQEILSLFHDQWEAIQTAIEAYELVEVNTNGIKVHF